MSAILYDIAPGGFLTGLIIPHENGFAISVVERLEDVVSNLLMPIVRKKPLLEVSAIDLCLVLHPIWLANKPRPLE